MGDKIHVEQKFADGYILPDHAVDLDTWLRDGMEVYNILVYMKPLFFQMLEALGGKFEGSWAKANEDRLKYRVKFASRSVGTLGEGDYDEKIMVERYLAPPTTDQ